jgi:predicted dehydrogenase
MKTIRRRSILFGMAAMAGTTASPASSSRKVRVAVIGLGHAHAFGKLNALRALPQYELAGVFDGDPRLVEKSGAPLLTVDAILKNPGIELALIEGRVQDNLRYARMAVEAGKFVHLDKAPGEDLEDLKEILGEATRRKRVVQMGYQWRYLSGMRQAIEAARKGWLGDVYLLRSTIDKPIPSTERQELGRFRGGMMFELGCHILDRAVDLLGTPRKVTGILRHDSSYPDKLADNTLAILEYERAIAEIHVAAMQPHGDQYRTFEILGANGAATLRPFNGKLAMDLKDAAGPYKAGQQVVEPHEQAGPVFAPDLIEMHRIIGEGVSPSYSVEHDLTTQEVLLRACGLI